MALTVSSSGTQTATISTEHSLGTTTTAGSYVLAVDCGNMVAGDVLELRGKVKVLSGGTENLAYYAAYANVQACPVKFSVPIPVAQFLEFTLKQTAGTGRAFDWSWMRLDA